MRTAILLLCLFTAQAYSQAIAQTGALHMVDVSSAKSISKNGSELTIAKKNRQSVAITENGYVATGILVVVPVAYHDVEKKLRHIVNQLFGEESYTETVIQRRQGSLACKATGKPSDCRDMRRQVLLQPIPKDEILVEDFRKLRANNINLEAFSLAEIKSKKYNKSWLSPDASQLQMKVLDGHEVYGIKSTLIVVTRHDAVWEFGFGHSIFPKYADFGGYLVTNQEIAIIKELENQYQKKVGYFAPERIDNLPLAADSFIEGRKWLAR